MNELEAKSYLTKLESDINSDHDCIHLRNALKKSLYAIYEILGPRESRIWHKNQYSMLNIAKIII